MADSKSGAQASSKSDDKTTTGAQEPSGTVAPAPKRADGEVGMAATGVSVDTDPLAGVPTYAEREAYPVEPPVHADPTATTSYPSGVPLPAEALKGMEERTRQGIPEPPKPAGGTTLHDTPGGFQITPEGVAPEDVGPAAIVGPHDPRNV